MELVPDFRIGFYNAWMGIVPILISMAIIFIPNKNAVKRGSDMSSYNRKEKVIALASSGLFLLTLLYSVVVPLKLGTAWFFVGSTIYLFGMVPYIIGMCNFANTPLNAPVVKGVYKISRNPMYFFSTVTIGGIGIAGASWLIIFFVCVYAMLNHFTVLAEEKFCEQKYGESYRQYTQSVSRYFLFF